MRRFLLSIILICLLTVPASAHPGRTDGSGGHYDHDTGEYHYHHGYGAHDHYDMDGDGDIDCPYDFDDQTSQNSGTTSGVSSYSPSITTESDYRRGYESGKEDGYSDGFEDGKTFGQTAAEKRGYDEGYADGNSEGYSSGYSKARLLGFVGIAGVSAFGFLLLRHKQNRIDELKQEHACELREVDRELRAIKSERDKLLAQRKAMQSDCQSRIDQAVADCRKRIQENTDLYNVEISKIQRTASQKIAALNQEYSSDLADQRKLFEESCEAYTNNLRHWEAAAREIRLRKFLAHFPLDDIELSDIPADAELCGGSVSIGNASRQHPFGILTVYTAPNGRCYHRKRGCCGAFTPSNHYDMLLQSVPSCSKCCGWKDYAVLVPDWYIRYKEIISGTSER